METGAVMQSSLYRDLFNQNGMDFVTKKSFCKTPVVDEKMLILSIDRGWKSRYVHTKPDKFENAG